MSTFVFRPGGASGGNVFTNFAALSNALASAQGLKILEFDDSLVSPIELPTGTFDMHLVSWTGSAPRSGANHARVRIPEGCLLPGLRMISGQVEVECAAHATSPVADFATGARLIQIGSRLDDGAPFVYSTGPAPLFDLGQLPNDPSNQCTIVVSGHWGEATNPAITLTPVARMVSGRVIFRLKSFGSIGENMIDAGPGTTVLLDWDGGIESTKQESIRGALTIRNPGYRTRNRFVPQASAPGLPPVPSKVPIPANAMQTGDLLLFAPEANANVHQTLPKIVGAFVSQGRAKSTLGHQVIVKNAGKGKVLVKGAELDLIDGEPGDVRVGPGESCIFASDGVSNWYVVSFSPKPQQS
jgi:hypothetical protein